MTEIISLNKARKQKAKQAKRENAIQNRAKSGLKKQARAVTRHEQKVLTLRLDGAKLPPSETDDQETT